MLRTLLLLTPLILILTSCAAPESEIGADDTSQDMRMQQDARAPTAW
jgi:hypothetical protein